MTMMHRFNIRLDLAAMLIALAFSISCGDVVRDGQSPAYLIINSITAASGARPGVFGNVLASDVVTIVERTVAGTVTQIPTVFEDPAQAIVTPALKDIGSVIGATTPTSNNQITITRYRVTYRRADGRNTPGVDVPYGFDGAVTVTTPVPAGSVAFGFTLVRVQAKEEPPLRNLRGGGGASVISTIADVTFFGHDQVGNAVSVTGSISVNFADWGDPIGAGQ
jgi:hypothetical protein